MLCLYTVCLYVSRNVFQLIPAPKSSTALAVKSGCLAFRATWRGDTPARMRRSCPAALAPAHTWFPPGTYTLEHIYMCNSYDSWAPCSNAAGLVRDLCFLFLVVVVFILVFDFFYLAAKFIIIISVFIVLVVIVMYVVSCLVSVPQQQQWGAYMPTATTRWGNN